MKYKYSIVIPTFNERDNIKELISRIGVTLAGFDYEIIVVDDDSPDKTWEAVNIISSNNSRVFCLRRLNCYAGLSPSIVDGLKHARGEILAVMDGDMQHDESYLPEMFKAAEYCDIVLGTRYANGGQIENSWPVSRRIISKCAAQIAKIFLGLSVSDPMSGYFIIRKNLFNKIEHKLNPKGFKIFLEILYTAQKADKKVRLKEVGIRFRSRVSGNSKLGLKVIVNYLMSLLEIKYKKV